MRKIIRDILFYSTFQLLYVSALCSHHKKNLIFLKRGENATGDHKPLSFC